MQLRGELESATAESVGATDAAEEAELEMVRPNVSTLSEERDQLLELLQDLREEKNQMSSQLEEKNHAVNRILILPALLISISHEP